MTSGPRRRSRSPRPYPFITNGWPAAVPCRCRRARRIRPDRRGAAARPARALNRNCSLASGSRPRRCRPRPARCSPTPAPTRPAYAAPKSRSPLAARAEDLAPRPPASHPRRQIPGHRRRTRPCARAPPPRPPPLPPPLRPRDAGRLRAAPALRGPPGDHTALGRVVCRALPHLPQEIR